MMFHSMTGGMTSRFLHIRNGVCALLGAAFALTAPAATVYWSGAGDGTSWNDPANWQGGTVPNGAADIATFTVRNNGVTLNASGTFTLRQLYFYVPMTLTIPAGCTLYLSNSGGAVIDAFNDVTLDGAGDLSLSTAGGVNYADVRPAIGVTLTIAARVTGAGGVENNGAGTIRLTNPQNTYPGLTYITVGNGVIEFPTMANAGVPSAIGAGNGFLATTASTLFRFTGSEAASTDRSFAIGSSPVGFEQAGSAPVTLTGTVTNQSAGTRSFRLINNTAQAAVFAGQLSNGPGTLNLIKEGAGPWTLNTPNTYTGFTQIVGGTLEIAAGGTIGSGPLLITGGATLSLNPSAAPGFSLTLPPVAVTGSGRIAIPAASSGTSTLTLTSLAVNNGFLLVDAPDAGTAANRILIAGGLAAGPVAWIRLNGGGAQYDAADGLKPYAVAPSVHIAARGGVIPAAPGETVAIDTPGTTGPVTLAAPLTEIGLLAQEEPATEASVDLAGGVLAAGEITLAATGAALTLSNGTLTAAGASPAVTNAGLNTVATALLTDDASTGISSAKTYTHALDFGDQPAATINGVAFTQVTTASGTLPATPYGWSGLPTTKYNNFGDWTNTVPASATGLRLLLKDMLYDGRATSVKLTGLTPGAAYEMRLFTRSWDGLASTTERTMLYAFHPSANAAPAARFAFDKNHNLPTVIIFRYIATSTELTIVSTTLSVTTNPWAGFYGLTHELLATAALPSGTATLALANNSAVPLTVAAAVADNGRPISLLRTGSGPLTLSGAVGLTGSTTLDSSLTLAPPGVVTQAFGPIHGGGGLVKRDAGTALLQSAGFYTGATLVEGGTLAVADSAALGSAGSGTTVASGAALALAEVGVNSLAVTEPITFTGAGPDGLGALRTDSPSQQQNAFRSLALGGDATVGGTAATPLIPFENGKGSFSIRNGTLALAGHTLTKAGPGAFLLSSSRLTGVTGGAIDVAGGALGLEYSADLGGTSGNTLTVRTGANLDLNRVYVPQSWALALEDGAHVSARSSTSLSENIWDGPVSLAAGQALLGGVGTLSVAGPVSGPGGLVKARGTTYLLNPTNTYAGATAVTNGMLYAAAPGALPDRTPAKLTVRQNGTLTVRYADDTGTWPLAWAADDVDAIATSAIFTQSSAALGFDPYYAGATYDGGLTGFGLAKYGTNTMTLTGAENAPGHIRVYEGTLVLAGGTYNLLGTSSLYPGNTGSTASLGTLSITGDTQVIGTDTGYRKPVTAISPGHFANSRGILNISDNAFLQGRLYVAENSAGAGAIYQSGGTFNNTGGAGQDGRLGHSGYGYYRLDGGTVTNKGYTQLGADTSAIGILHQTGGTFIFNNGSVPTVDGTVGPYYGGTLATRGGNGLFHIAGGTLDTGNTPLQLAEWDGWGSYVNGYSVLTLEGDGLVKTAYVNMADRNSAPVSVVNLNGGTLQTQYLRKGNRDNPAAAVASVNFNGGTLRAAASVALASAAGTRFPDFTVFGGGAVVDTAGFDPSIPCPVAAPTGYGVTGIRVTYPGSGYIAPPLVKITGGGGRGATAVAEIDRAAGTLSAIRITSPGTGYTSVPTVALLGGGYQTTASNGLVTIGTDLSAGGLTKRGAGSLTLYGTNTWRGPTVVEAGTLIAATPSALPAGSPLVIDGGTFSLSGQTLTNARATIIAGGIASGTLVTTALRKEGPGEAVLSSLLQLTPAAAPAAAVTPGLWEGVIFKNWDTLAPNPKTSVVLTTRAGNGPKTNNFFYADGSWINNNHTWVYSGYLWNRAATNVTWTWRGTFDDNVMLKIDQVIVLNTGNGGATASYTLKPGPHAIEIRFGDGTGNVGPDATLTNLGGLTYNAGDGLGWRLLADPGDGSLLTVDLGAAAPLPPAVLLPPEVAANVGDLAANYSLVYASDVPVKGGTINGSSAGSPYSIDNSAANTNAFDRVAYYLELVTAGVTNWVWVSFDALALDRTLIGYPTAAKKIVMQQRLANMDVRSNVAGINAATASQAGNIEFWPNNYGQSDALGLGASSATDNTGYDFGDSMSGAPVAAAGHGSMQLHNAGDGTTLLALSNFGSGDNTLGIGIGNRTGANTSPDWTNAGNGGSYDSRRLYVFTRDVAPGVQPPPAPAVVSVAEGTLRLDMPYAGLYEGMVRSAWTSNTPNPRTSVQLTTRAGNIPKAHNTTSGIPAITNFWANNNHTWIYTGYLWNRTAADVTWTFAASFDDHAWLMIDGQEIVHNINSGWTRKNVTLSPGPHAIEIRYSDGSGDVGPAQSGLPGGLCYTSVIGSTNPADYIVLTDPGDGSLLTTRAEDTAYGIFDGVKWDIAAGATLDLGGDSFGLDTVSGAGTLANGALGGDTVLSPGGDGALGVLTLTGITFDGTVIYRADVGPGATSDRIVTAGALDVSPMRVTVNNPAVLRNGSTYLLLQADSGLVGLPDDSSLPDKWRVVKRGNTLLLLRPSGTMMLLR